MMTSSAPARLPSRLSSSPATMVAANRPSLGSIPNASAASAPV